MLTQNVIFCLLQSRNHLEILGLTMNNLPPGYPPLTINDMIKEVSRGVGDVDSKEKGSGARYNIGKPDFSLIPLCTMEDEARVWEYGKRKYAAWNWAKGMSWDIPYSCMMRHLSAWQRGEENDPESGLPHLAHAMCNLRMLVLFSRTFPEGDTRPKEWIA